MEPSNPQESPEIEVLENGRLVETFRPDIFRWDLSQQGYGNGTFGFLYPVTARYLNGKIHELHFRFKTGGASLQGSPVRLAFTLESRDIPFESTDLTGRRVLVLAPHPDDESLCCGGSLILHREHRDPVKVIFLTDGSASEHDGTTAEAISRLRQDEARKAASILGVEDLEFWGVRDRTLSLDSGTMDRLVLTLNRYQPELIYLPSPLDFHPDHRATTDLLWSSIQKSQLPVKLAFFDLNRPIKINTLVDITPVVDRKRRACDSYQSQLRHHPYTDIALAFNRYRAMTISPACDHAEGFFLMDSQDVLQHPVEYFYRLQSLPLNNGTESDRPLISVIIRTKNRPQPLREALSSVITQTYSNMEVIVVNDGGCDVSAIIEEFSSYVPISCRVLETSTGRSAAANIGVSMAQGKYINFLDDDDLFYATHVEKLALYLEATGEHFAYSDCHRARYSWDGKRHVVTTDKKLFLGLAFDRDRLYLSNFIPIMTAMFSRELWEKAGGFDESLSYYEDWDLWLRMVEFAVPQHLPGVTAEYRILQQQSFDAAALSMILYHKHRNYWTVENLVRVWKRLDDAQCENRDLRRLLDSTRVELKDVKADLVWCNRTWSSRLARFLRRLLM